MSRLHQLHEEHGQSPWLDNLRRDWIDDGTLQGWIDRGVRGITSNPSIFQKAITAGDAYDTQFRLLMNEGDSIEAAYWAMVVDDIRRAASMLLDVHQASNGLDGYVSLEVAPDLAHKPTETRLAARDLADRVDAQNLMVKIPGTEAGLPAIRDCIGAGLNINVTLLFSVERYRDVMDAYLTGLEAREGSLAGIRSVASFFISRVDTEVDRRLDAIGSPEAKALKGGTALAQARVAYQAFLEVFSGPRWEALADRGANLQRPLWASTSTKNPSYPDTMYVDGLIGPQTVNTLPEDTLDAFDDHGTLARTIDADPEAAQRHLDAVREVGVDLDDVAEQLEEEGVAAFAKSFDQLLDSLKVKAADTI